MMSQTSQVRKSTGMGRQMIVAVDGLPQQGIQRMAMIAARHGAELQVLPEADGWKSFPRGAEAAFGMPPAALVEGSDLRFVQLHSAGYDGYCTPPLLQRKDFCMANARGVTAQAVAEHCLSMMFGIARQGAFHAIDQARSAWVRHTRYEVLSGSGIAIVGTGAIGSALGRMCRGIGMRVLAVQRRTERPAWADAVYPFDRMCDALGQARHLALAMPALPGPPLIGARELRCLQKGGYVYNVGRASALDYGALLSALDDGTLAGAGLDVFPTEPLPPDDPLWTRPNVLVSPHVGGRFAGEMDALAELFADNLQRYLERRGIRNVVIGSSPSEA